MKRLLLVLLVFWSGCQRQTQTAPEWVFSTFDRKFWHGWCSMTPPQVSHGVLYFAGGYAWDKKQTHAYAVDPDTGQIMWKRYLGGPVNSLQLNSESVFVSDVNGMLWALDRKDGSLRWWLPYSGHLHLVANGDLVFSYSGSSFQAISAQTGQVLWQVPQQSRLRAPAIAFGDSVYLWDDGKLHTLDRRSGRVLDTLDHPRIGPPRLAGDRLYFKGRENPNSPWQSLSLDISTGKLSPSKRFLGLDQGVLHFFSDSTIEAVDLEGKRIWTSPPLEAAAIQPILAAEGSVAFRDGRLVYPDLVGKIRNMHAFDALSGRALWTFETGDVVEYQSTIYNQRAIFASDDCNVYAVRLDRSEGRRGLPP